MAAILNRAGASGAEFGAATRRVVSIAKLNCYVDILRVDDIFNRIEAIVAGWVSVNQLAPEVDGFFVFFHASGSIGRQPFG